ncbi:MAG: Na+/H+ antiporter NhaA [Chitinophagaceae bacterium]|nr:Na+/H+ antiporter NhaA [Chitinophagaceae bacterium]
MIKKLTTLYNEFFKSEKSGGFLLMACTAISLLLANVWIGNSYVEFWQMKLGWVTEGFTLRLSLEHWINDGLMAVFFLLIGLEIERELYTGELSDWHNAMLPIAAAIGGMMIPGLIHFAFNAGTAAQKGFGIPMATDIAFALGILSLAGNKVSASLKIFLTALAIIDDLGAILIIAVFYTHELNISALFLSLGIFIVLLILNRLKIHRLWPYLAGGLLMWYFMLKSGVHATLSGVLLAFAIPFGDGKEKSPSYRLQHALHKPVAFLILPLFALANTAMILDVSLAEALTQRNSLGILLGLLIGKPIGILLFCFIAIKSRISLMPEDLSWRMISGGAVLAGIGFTMSIFISLLAFYDSPEFVKYSKMSILTASVLAGMCGYLILQTGNKKIVE